MNTDVCETCLRWPECNGVIADICPIVAACSTEKDMSAEEETETMERDPLPRPEKNTVKKSYHSPVLPILHQARSKLK